MFTRETHLLSTDLGTLELWCNRCGCHVSHDLIVTTDNEVVRTLGSTYQDQNRITSIQAECLDGHRQTVL